MKKLFLAILAIALLLTGYYIYQKNFALQGSDTESLHQTKQYGQITIDTDENRKAPFKDSLRIVTFDLTPPFNLAIPEEREKAKQFGENVVEVVKTMLYAKTGIEDAESRGRKLHYDPATFKLTISDTQGNLEGVSRYINYINSLSQENKEE